MLSSLSYFEWLAIYVQSHGLGVERKRRCKNRHCSSLENGCPRRWLLGSVGAVGGGAGESHFSDAEMAARTEEGFHQKCPSCRQKLRTSVTQLSGIRRGC